MYVDPVRVKSTWGLIRQRGEDPFSNRTAQNSNGGGGAETLGATGRSGARRPDGRPVFRGRLLLRPLRAPDRRASARRARHGVSAGVRTTAGAASRTGNDGSAID